MRAPVPVAVYHTSGRGKISNMTLVEIQAEVDFWVPA